jgi:hypothetical protein
LLSCSPPTAFAADITINQTVKYYDEKIIAAKIKSERVTLGPKLVASTEAAVQKNGWSVIKKDVVDGTGNGVNLKLTITNAHSSGNAFIGHHKSVGIMAELFRSIPTPVKEIHLVGSVRALKALLQCLSAA